MADQWTPKWPGKHVGSLDVARKLRDRLPAGTSNGDLLVWEDPPGRWVAGAPVAGSLNELGDATTSPILLRTLEQDHDKQPKAIHKPTMILLLFFIEAQALKFFNWTYAHNTVCGQLQLCR